MAANSVAADRSNILTEKRFNILLGAARRTSSFCKCKTLGTGAKLVLWELKSRFFRERAYDLSKLFLIRNRIANRKPKAVGQRQAFLHIISCIYIVDLKRAVGKLFLNDMPSV